MLHVSRLHHDRIDAAFPLMQSALPRLTLEEWRRYAATLDGMIEDPSDPRGIMVATAPNGVLRAAFVYTLEYHGDDGTKLIARKLVVHHVTVPPLAQRLAANIMAKTMRRLASEHDCESVVVVLPGDAAWQIDYFSACGFQVDITESALSPASQRV